MKQKSHLVIAVFENQIVYNIFWHPKVNAFYGLLRNMTQYENDMLMAFVVCKIDNLNFEKNNTIFSFTNLALKVFGEFETIKNKHYIQLVSVFQMLKNANHTQWMMIMVVARSSEKIGTYRPLCVLQMCIVCPSQTHQFCYVVRILTHDLFFNSHSFAFFFFQALMLSQTFKCLRVSWLRRDFNA